MINDCSDPYTWNGPRGDGSSGNPCTVDADCPTGEQCSPSKRCLLPTNQWFGMGVDLETVDVPPGLGSAIKISSDPNLGTFYHYYLFCVVPTELRDMTAAPIIKFWHKVSDPTLPFVVQVNWDSHYAITQDINGGPILANTYQQVAIDLRDVPASGPMPDLSNITFIRSDLQPQGTNPVQFIGLLENQSSEPCAIDADCPPCHECQSQICVPLHGVADPRCPSDKPYCSNGVCVQCISNADCGPNEQCVNGVCTPIGGCTSSFQCGLGQVCVNGLCVDHAPCSPPTVWDESQKACVLEVTPPGGGIVGPFGFWDFPMLNALMEFLGQLGNR